MLRSLQYTGLIIFCVATFSLKASATLGMKDTNLEAEALNAGSKHAMSVLPQYNVHDITNASTDLKQYADKSGTVFAASWHGAHAPDFEPLFGEYYQDFVDAQKKSPRRRARGGMLIFKGAHIVVEESGHMRSVTGKAYVLDLMPAGVSAADVK